MGLVFEKHHSPAHYSHKGLSMANENLIAAVCAFRKAVQAFSDATDNKAYRDKNHVEQDAEEILNAVYMSLDKLERFYKGEHSPPNRSKADELASKMSTLAQSLREGNARIDDKAADGFMQAIGLFDIAREAKEKGKTAALKDKYEKI